MDCLLEKFYMESSGKYKMKLIAGKEGIHRHVSWMHILEDRQIAEFIHGDELVFTTGLTCINKEWLLDLIHSLNEKNACGLVINIGPHIRAIYKEAISLCDYLNFPLLTIPWEIKLVDVTRDFSRQILKAEQRELSVAAAVKNAIFYPQVEEQYLPHLQRAGYDIHGMYQVLMIGVKGEFLQEEVLDWQKNLKNRIHFLNEKSISFSYLNDMAVVFVSTGTERLAPYIDRFLAQIEKENGKNPNVHPYLGLGSFASGVKNLSRSFQHAVAAMGIAKIKNQAMIRYEHMGSYKLLVDGADRATQKEFLQEMLGKLSSYDQKNHTDYLTVLRLYLQYDGSVQKVAQRSFCHRNTINYKIKKITQILDIDFKSNEATMNLLLAFQIYDIIFAENDGGTDFTGAPIS
ncbi:PucR family transcriptional regulator ligand-binding domain-containing protein [Lachnospiraceae bacterium ZAX-1]